jgi:hypothetical protein
LCSYFQWQKLFLLCIFPFICFEVLGSKASLFFSCFCHLSWWCCLREHGWYPIWMTFSGQWNNTLMALCIDW